MYPITSCILFYQISSNQLFLHRNPVLAEKLQKYALYAASLILERRGRSAVPLLRCGTRGSAHPSSGAKADGFF